MRASSRGGPTVQFGAVVVDGIVQLAVHVFLLVRGGVGGMKGRQVEFWGGALE